MIAFFIANIGTAAVGGVVGLLFVLAIAGMIRNRRKGKCAGCAGCAMAERCGKRGVDPTRVFLKK